jgi:hypothetical protein
MRSDGYTISPVLSAWHQIVKDCAQARAETAFRLMREAQARVFVASRPRLRRAGAR